MTPSPIRALLLGALFLGATQAAAQQLPSYDRTLLLETTSETSANASFGDLDGDGHLDIVLAKGRHWPLVNRVLLGDGKGGIKRAYDLGTASDKTYSGRLVDIDGDGDLDVVISNDQPSPKLVYLNDGKGRFTVGSEYGKPDWPMRNATVADMNGDGRPDIIAANRYGRAAGFNYICLNRGAGKFDADCIPFSAEPSTTITAADFNGDGLPDLLVPHRNGGQSRLYLGAKGADLAKLRSVPFGPADAQIRIAEAADVDGDGKLDVVTIDEAKGVMIHPGKGDGTFGAPRLLADRTVVPYALTIADLDKDGRQDIIVGNVESPTVAYFNGGAGKPFTPVKFGDNKGTAYGIAVADFDADGRADIAVARSEAPNALYFARGASAPAAQQGALQPGQLRLTYIGNAGWEITDGKIVVLVDPFLSQFARWRPGGTQDPAMDAPYQPDTAFIAEKIKRADYIVITHGHSDHALDAGVISRRTGAVILGSETVANLARLGRAGQQPHHNEGRRGLRLRRGLLRARGAEHPQRARRQALLQQRARHRGHRTARPQGPAHPPRLPGGRELRLPHPHRRARGARDGVDELSRTRDGGPAPERRARRREQPAPRDPRLHRAPHARTRLPRRGDPLARGRLRQPEPRRRSAGRQAALHRRGERRLPA